MPHLPAAAAWKVAPAPRPPVPGTRPQVATCVSGGSVGAQGSFCLWVLSPQAWSHSWGPQRPGLPGAFPRRKPTGAQNSSEISSGKRGPNMDKWDMGQQLTSGEQARGTRGALAATVSPSGQQLGAVFRAAQPSGGPGPGEAAAGPRGALAVSGTEEGGRSPLRALRQPTRAEAPRALRGQRGGTGPPPARPLLQDGGHRHCHRASGHRWDGARAREARVRLAPPAPGCTTATATGVTPRRAWTGPQCGRLPGQGVVRKETQGHARGELDLPHVTWGDRSGGHSRSDRSGCQAAAPAPRPESTARSPGAHGLGKAPSEASGTAAPRSLPPLRGDSPI